MRIALVILALAPFLGGCPAPVSMDMGRLGETYVEGVASPAELRVVETSMTLDECGLAEEIGDDLPNVEVIDSHEFWRTAFPEPVPWSDVETLLADPDVTQRLAELQVDYVVAVGGETDRTPTVGQMTCSMQGCGGLLMHDEWTDLQATIWDMEQDAAVESVVAKGSAKSVLAAFILPVVWMEPYTESRTCSSLGDEIGAVVSEMELRETIEVAVVGIHGSEIQNISADDLEDLQDLAAEGDEGALYQLASHYQRIGEWNTIPHWQTETQYRLGLASTGKRRWGWICRAAYAGHAGAQAQAGWASEVDYYTDGIVPTDMTEAYKWYRLAVMNGEITAAEDMARLRPSLSEAQVAEAEHRASQWRPAPCPDVPQPEMGQRYPSNRSLG